ncbi:MAG: hypothetical protein FIB06_00690 [Betaproteobacteria bacterium]|nr:hypothetical protein [Betaproteobacteria bacterium]
MKAAEYIDAAKERLNVRSDYAIAKKLGIGRNGIPEIRSGKRALPLEAAYHLAIILDKDPAAVIAELQMERETNPQRAEFWRSFLSRAASVLAVIACTLALSFSNTAGTAPAAAGFGRRWKFA